jgi:hypothetical protein
VLVLPPAPLSPSGAGAGGSANAPLIKTEEGIKPPAKFFEMKGVFAVSGKSPVTIYHQTNPSMEIGSWSISMWMRLLEGPTGSFRSLFFKGDKSGFDGQRTPSVWLLPNANRLAIRVSTAVNADSGADSTLEIPLGHWSFLTFVFNNNSQVLEDPKSLIGIDDEFMNHKTKSFLHNNIAPYDVSIYLNGALDVNLQFANVALGNQGPLQFFKDISHDGLTSVIYFLSCLI